jgi:hypothetical protein
MGVLEHNQFSSEDIRPSSGGHFGKEISLDTDKRQTQNVSQPQGHK